MSAPAPALPLQPQPPARRHHGPTAGTAPPGPSATCLLGARLPPPAPSAITLMTLGSGLEKSTVPARHCRVPKLAPSRPEGWGGCGSPPRIPPPQENGKRRYGNGCKAHPPRALRCELCPIPKPPAARGERGRPAAAKGNPERKPPFEGLIL